MGLGAGFRAAVWLIGALSLAAVALLAAVPAVAQTAPPPNPSSPDGRGVDLISGKLVTSATDVAIGPGDQNGLSFSRQWVNTGWRIANVPTMSGSTSNPIVSFSGGSIPFETVAGHYEPKFEDGSTLSNDRTTFTASDGTVVTFGYPGMTFAWVLGDVSLGVGTSVTFPGGLVRNYNYKIQEFTFWTPGGPQSWYAGRLSSITNSAGFQIKLSYAADGGDVSAFFRLTKVTALNNAVEYCSPTEPCTLTSSWPEATYTNFTGGGALDGVTTSVSTTATTYSYNTSGNLTGIRPPGASSNVLNYTYTSNKVTSFSSGGGTWNYTYGSGYTTVTDPFSNPSSIYFNSTGLVTSSVTGGQTTTFAYCGASESNCPENLLKRVTAPEGNYIQYAYDTRGNRTSETHVAKPGSGLANIVMSATFPSTCTNQKTCNKPLTATDARGQVTDFTYDAGHGGLLTTTLPADANGIRPQTRITYSNQQAYYKNSSGSIVASGLNMALPVQTASCRTSGSCTNGTDERKTVIGYGPQTAGVANNLLPVSVTTSRGDGALAATATTSYDSRGHVVTTDGPLSGTTDQALYAYRDDGRLGWVIAPDPDGAGSAKYPATYYNYTPDGQLSFVQQGTVDNQLSGAWSTWVELGRNTTTYDAYLRPVREVATGVSLTTYQVTDYRYDNASRLLCTVVRMDSANWGAPAASCSPPQADDRVTYNHYDALGRVDYVQSGYGTTAVATDVTRTFTANGQVLTVTDAEGNLTTYAYDGHDRLYRAYFPSPTTDGVSSSTDYEQLGYDANGNVTSLRTRANDALAMTYDNLNRLLIKAVPERAGNWCGLGATGQCDTYTRDVYYAYDLFGDLTVAGFDSWTPSEKVVNTFNALGQFTASESVMNGVSRTLGYQYDVAGNLTRITHPDGNYVNYYQYASGALNYASLNGGSDGLFIPTRDTAGRVNLLRRWNTSTPGWSFGTTYNYDAMSRLAGFTHDPVGTSYDTTTTFTYNPAQQIASSARSNDAYAFPGYTGVNRNYTANGLNQYSAVGGTSFSYDGNANLTHSVGANPLGQTVTADYVYDPENRMVRSYAVNGTTGGSYVTYMRYDPLGRLYEVNDSSMGTRRFLYDGDALVAEYNTGGTLLRRYVHGGSAGDDPLVWFEGSGVTNAARRYLYADERGSIVAVTDGAGNVTNVNTYDENGIPASTNVGAFQYTGQVWLPELGMYYYKARMYSPTLGRFMQTDPIGYGDGMNMYRYVGSDPINGTDPTGLCGPGDRAPTEDESAACQAQQVEQYKDYHPVDYLAGNMMAGWALGQIAESIANSNIQGAQWYWQSDYTARQERAKAEAANSPPVTTGAPTFGADRQQDPASNLLRKWQVTGVASGVGIQEVKGEINFKGGRQMNFHLAEGWTLSNGQWRPTDLDVFHPKARNIESWHVSATAYFYPNGRMPSTMRANGPNSSGFANGLPSIDLTLPNTAMPTEVRNLAGEVVAPVGPVTVDWIGIP